MDGERFANTDAADSEIERSIENDVILFPQQR